MTQNTICRFPSVLAGTGLSRSTIHRRIHEGLFPRPVSLGAKAVGWPAVEIDALNAARIAGKSDDEIRELVQRMHEARKSEGGVAALNAAQTAGRSDKAPVHRPHAKRAALLVEVGGVAA